MTAVSRASLVGNDSNKLIMASVKALAMRTVEHLI
jgi:hypothetical protein